MFIGRRLGVVTEAELDPSDYGSVRQAKALRILKSVGNLHAGALGERDH